MFDVGASELLVILIVAVVFIGPKDMPAALRLAGRWVGKIRRTSAHFRAGFDAMVREAELEEMEREWKARNAEIMAKSAPEHVETKTLDSADGATPAPTPEVGDGARQDEVATAAAAPEPSDKSAL